MRLIWLSDSPQSPSGFGNVTKYVCRGLASNGYEVHILGWQTLFATVPWEKCILHSARYPDMGARVMYDYASRIPVDFAITLGLAHTFEPIQRAGLQNWLHRMGTKWVIYYPVDGEDSNGKLPANWSNVIQQADVKVVCSNYGVEVSRRSGVHAEFIPHGVDTHLFCPPDNKEDAKKKLNYDGRFVVLSDARNQPRKMLPRLLQAFGKFAEGKQDVVLHLHTDADDPASEEAGYDLRRIIRVLRLEDKVRFTNGFKFNRGISLESLRGIYQASDVHLLVSGGEGFGLPTLQASSTGLVPFGPDYSSNPELISGHGELLRVSGFVDGRYGIKWALIDTDYCAQQLQVYYDNTALCEGNGKAARKFAENYSWEAVVTAWNKLLTREKQSPN